MVDGSDEAATAMTMVVKNNPEHDFVKRVIKEALSDDVNDLKLLVFAVHAVNLKIQTLGNLKIKFFFVGLEEMKI
jgi:hypothetical protein